MTQPQISTMSRLRNVSFNILSTRCVLLIMGGLERVLVLEKGLAESPGSRQEAPGNPGE